MIERIQRKSEGKDQPDDQRPVFEFTICSFQKKKSIVAPTECKAIPRNRIVDIVDGMDWMDKKHRSCAPQMLVATDMCWLLFAVWLIFFITLLQPGLFPQQRQQAV